MDGVDERAPGPALPGETRAPTPSAETDAAGAADALAQIADSLAGRATATTASATTAAIATAPATATTSAGPPTRFRRNRGELLWLGCVLALGLVFSITIAGVLADRLAASWRSGERDWLVDGLWIASCLAIFAVVGLVGREVVRFWRKQVVVDAAGLRVGSVALAWHQLALLREGREFRAGEWFYHLEIRGRGGERAWVTSGLIADYPAFRAELLRRGPQVPMVLLPD